MANGIRIDELDATVLPSRDHVVPAMKDGLTVKLTVGQILDLLGKVLDPDEVGSKALFAALNLSDLDDPEQARENLGATEIGDALFTAMSKAAGRSAIDALGPSETADKAFRRGNILGTVSQSGGVPTGALIERGSNANGEYVRFADGTQICSAGEVLGGSTWTYPAAFIDVPSVSGTVQSTAFRVFKRANTSAISVDIKIVDASNAEITNAATIPFAIGRWL